MSRARSRHRLDGITFERFLVAALDLYNDLETDNTKSFWEEHKAVYASAIAAPLKALTGDLASQTCVIPPREAVTVTRPQSVPLTRAHIAEGTYALPAPL